MKQHDILLLNMSTQEEWDRGVRNRNYFVYRELRTSPAIGKILSVDVLPHTWKRGLRDGLRMHRHRRGRTIHRSLFAVCEELEPKKLAHATTVLPLLSAQATDRFLQYCIRAFDMHNVLVWSYLPTFPQIFSHFNKTMTIFDAVDDWSAHPAYHNIKKGLQKNYGLIDRSAGTIFTVSQECMRLFPTNNNVHWIPNGVDVGPPVVDATAPSAPYKARLVYLGVIQERVDLALLGALATQRPHYELVIAGPVWRGIDVSALRSLPNVRLTGFLPSQKVPALLAAAQVGLVPHTSDALVRSMNPMKIYEYLAAGLPVVTTPLEGFDAYRAGVTIAQTQEEFLRAVDFFVERPPVKKALQELVMHDTWHQRVELMLRTIPALQEQS